MTTRFKDHVIPINKGLLWKEWRQNRLYFLLAFLIMSYEPIIKTLIYIIKDSVGTYAGGYTSYQCFSDISNMLSFSYQNTLEQGGLIISILLGIVILMQERSGSLNYLITTPVSRREIILAKFITGSTAIISIMLLNVLFITITALLQPVDYNTVLVIKWGLLTTSAFLAMFSIGLMIASFTGNFLSSIALGFILPNLPVVLKAMFINENTRAIFDFSPRIISKIDSIVHFITIPDYITRGIELASITGPGVNLTAPNYLVETLLLLIFTVLFIFIAVKLFKNNILENNGQMFIFDNAQHGVQIIVAAIIAINNASMRSVTKGEFLSTLALTFIITYLIIILISSLLYYTRQKSGKIT